MSEDPFEPVAGAYSQAQADVNDLPACAKNIEHARQRNRPSRIAKAALGWIGLVPPPRISAEIVRG